MEIWKTLRRKHSEEEVNDEHKGKYFSVYKEKHWANS
jgi:hypothetical protein